MTTNTLPHNRYLFVLAAIFAIEWLALAIKPYDRPAWLLENALVFLFVVIIALEWAAAELFGGDLGVAYLGIKGDVWDAHKDMLLASVGAFTAMTITAAINIYLNNDFAREWVNSLKVKLHRPLGEDEIRRLWRRRKKK